MLLRIRPRLDLLSRLGVGPLFHKPHSIGISSSKAALVSPSSSLSLCGGDMSRAKKLLWNSDALMRTRRDFRESHLPPESYMAKILKSRCQKDAESGQRPQGGRENSIVVQVHMFQSLHGSQIERIYILV